ncbi:VOC family protein [uncultured Oscillibacter sp.]|jgi:glyoxylase I family protein|uniref:SMU1112c/YaeR family gloxylase I-like metalloprotein n=1 Tax=uncultured Oscillibacter sp. TaxID=876091 RepID=UPI002171D0E3|nr:VOC family protein [uncultured Oscillibacter sp.]MCI9555205.1 VOC family protein [Oscillibacter sp.]
MRFEKLHHVAMIVSDYQRAREFYVEKLGFPILRENFREERGDWKLDLKFGDGELEIFAIPGAPPRPTYPEAQGLRHLAFRVEDIEEAVRELEALGIPCEEIRWDPYSEKRMTFFHDPDGLPLELHE